MDDKIKRRNLLIKQLRREACFLYKLLREAGLLEKLPEESLRFWVKQFQKEDRINE